MMDGFEGGMTIALTHEYVSDSSNIENLITRFPELVRSVTTIDDQAFDGWDSTFTASPQIRARIEAVAACPCQIIFLFTVLETARKGSTQWSLPYPKR